jgi:hypothetical protein
VLCDQLAAGNHREARGQHHAQVQRGPVIGRIHADQPLTGREHRIHLAAVSKELHPEARRAVVRDFELPRLVDLCGSRPSDRQLARSRGPAFLDRINRQVATVELDAALIRCGHDHAKRSRQVATSRSCVSDSST